MTPISTQDGAAGTASATVRLAGAWRADVAHSSVRFAVAHMVVSTFRGELTEFEATFEAGADRLALTGSGRVASVTTRDDTLTAHLRAPDFFDADRYPEIRLASTSVAVAGDRVTVEAGLTIKGITRPVVLTGTLAGPVDDPFGGARLGLDLEGTIDRRDFGLDWNLPPGRRTRPWKRDRPERTARAGQGYVSVRVLAVSGSLRRASYNSALLRAAAAAAPAGVMVELWDGLAAIPPFCEDDEAGRPPWAVRELRARIAAADALLLATPEYNGSVPGHLKTAVDWASRPFGESALWDKPSAVVGASTGSFGGVRAQEELRGVLRTAGARVVGSALAVPRAHEHFDESGELVTPELRSRLAAVLGDLVATADGRSAVAA
jgi:chromate reductase